MGQILGLGITHYPPMSYKGNMSGRIKLLLADPMLPEKLRSPEGWHPTMREQWSTDEGLAHSEKHRNDLIHYFRKTRAELDAFQPDLVLLWGDDQYENYREDCVPPLSRARPSSTGPGRSRGAASRSARRWRARSPAVRGAWR